MNPIRTLTAVGATVALAAVAAGCGNSTSAKEPAKTQATKPAAPQATKPAAAQAPSGATVTGTVSEWSVALSPAKVPAGKVTFKVTNSGKLPHEFVILRTAKAADKLGSGTRVSESGDVGEVGGLAAGATKSVTLNLKPGHYAVICNLPSHYKMGMRADLTVG